MKKTFWSAHKHRWVEVGRIKYFQGVWACEVLVEKDGVVKYVPLEGYGKGQRGEVFYAPSYLFEDDKRQ